MVAYVDVVVAVTVMRVLLYVFHVSMRRECERAGNTDVGDGGGAVVASTWHVVGTRSSGIVSSAAAVPGMSASVWDERTWWSV